MTKTKFLKFWLFLAMGISVMISSSCSKEKGEQLVGTWLKTSENCGNMTFTFNADKTFELHGIDCEDNQFSINGIYDYSANTLTLTYANDDDGIPDTYSYAFLNKNKLSLEMGETVIFTRQ